ncbi:MAG: copR [Blastococcus sp.]|jgi:DNA-binding response OmpR family regulator|nr:copR [Blastococcus sp.]
MTLKTFQSTAHATDLQASFSCAAYRGSGGRGAVSRVLIVDDEPAITDALRRGMAAEGFAVDVASGGPEGLLKATVGDYDVIVLDVMLPGFSGYEVLKRLRVAHVWTPVLMLTAKDGDYDIADALDLGADDHLAKPFGFVVLVARVRALQRRGARQRPAKHVLGDLVLDPARRRCFRAGTEVRLTAREFAVLECLIARPGDVVSKTQILHQVWDENYDGDPNIVEVYVGFLRRKVDTPFGRRTIATVRGAGYRLDVD